jgi:hypothetical protein
MIRNDLTMKVDDPFRGKKNVDGGGKNKYKKVRLI